MGFFFRKLEIRKWFEAQIFKSLSPAYNAGKGFVQICLRGIAQDCAGLRGIVRFALDILALRTNVEREEMVSTFIRRGWLIWCTVTVCILYSVDVPGLVEVKLVHYTSKNRILLCFVVPLIVQSKSVFWKKWTISVWNIKILHHHVAKIKG